MSSASLNLTFEPPPRRELPADRRDAIRRLLEDTVAGRRASRRRPPARPVLWPAVGLATASAVAAAVLVVGDLGSDGAATVHAATPPVLASELGIGEPAGPQLRELAAAAAGTAPRTYAAEPTVTTENWVLVVTDTGGTPGEDGDEVPPEGRAPIEGPASIEGAAANLSMGAPAVTTAVVPVLREQQFLADGSVRVRETQGRPQFPTDEWTATDSAVAGTLLADQTYPAGTLAEAYPADLTPDPATLRAQLLSVWPQADPAAGLFRALREVATSRVLGPAVQASALTMLAGEPDVVALGATIDRRGRDAVAFATDSADSGIDTRYVLLVDPTTGRLLGYEEVLTGDTRALELDSPVVTAYTAFL